MSHHCNMTLKRKSSVVGALILQVNFFTFFLTGSGNVAVIASLFLVNYFKEKNVSLLHSLLHILLHFEYSSIGSLGCITFSGSDCTFCYLCSKTVEITHTCIWCIRFLITHRFTVKKKRGAEVIQLFLGGESILCKD